MLRNFSDGWVFDTNWMFQLASAASNHPARNPTLGSGLGATDDIDPGDGDAPLTGAEPLMHEPRSNAVSAPKTAGIFLAEFIVGFGQGWASIFCMRSISVV